MRRRVDVSEDERGKGGRKRENNLGQAKREAWKTLNEKEDRI